jgi:pimeloyl-ACP methyl ester carboxylesterase
VSTRIRQRASATLRALGAVIAVIALLAIGAWLWLRGPDIPYAVLESRYAGQGSAYVDAPDGLRLHYQVSGPASAPTVVLLHGFGDSFTSWEHWLPVLSSDYRVITLDLPGHGLTRAPDGYVLSTDGLVQAVEDLAVGAKLEHFALAGNSLGGGVSWSYALKYPQRLTALILVDAAGWPQKPSGSVPLAFRILRYPIGRWLLAHIDNKPLINDGLKMDVHDPAVITQALVDRWAEFQRAPGHRPILMSLGPAALARASPAVLAAIHAPTLVLHGASDPLIDVDSARQFAAAITGATLIVYPDVGHLPQIEIPERSAHDVAAFLAQHPPAPTAPVD